MWTSSWYLWLKGFVYGFLPGCKLFWHPNEVIFKKPLLCENKIVLKKDSIKMYPTLGDAMDCSPPGSSVHGILQARILEWVAIPYSRRSSWPRNWTQVSSIAGRFFTEWAMWEAQNSSWVSIKKCPLPIYELPSFFKPPTCSSHDKLQFSERLGTFSPFPLWHWALCQHGCPHISPGELLSILEISQESESLGGFQGASLADTGIQCLRLL